MNLCNKTLPKGYLLAVLSKLTNSLNLNDLGRGVAQLTNHPTYFESAQHKYIHTTCSDTSQGHLMDVSCGQKSNDSKFHVENIGPHNGFGGNKKA